MKSFFNYSKDRSLFANIIFCILSFFGLFIFSGLIQIILNSFMSNKSLCNIISNFIIIVFLYLFYYRDLNREAKIYTSNFKENIKKSLKIYIIGFLSMIFINLLIAVFLGGISSNEEQVRDMLFNNTLITMISISIIAPISEELIFRKSLDPLFKNKWVYVIVSGLLFGLAHIMTNITSGIFKVTDLFYILPYGALGSSFALMDRENKTVFSSIVIHSFHNTCTALLLLALYKGGAI